MGNIISKDNKKTLEDYLPKIAKGAGIVFLGTILGRMGGYLFRVVAARGLGPESYGLITLGLAVYSIFGTLGDIGVPKGIVRYVSLYKGKDKPEGIKGTINSGIKILFPLSLFFGIFIFVSSNWISVNLFQEPRLAPVLKIIAFAVPISSFLSVFTSALQGFQRMDYRVYCRNIGEYFTRVALVALFVFLGFGVLGVAGGYVISVALGALLSFYLLHQRVFPFVKRKIKSSSEWRNLLTYSWPLMITSTVGLVTSWMDTFMLGAFKQAADVGIYNVARPTAQLMSGIPVGFGMIFLPVLSELYGKENKKQMGEVFRTVTGWVLKLLLPLGLLMFFFSKEIVKILYGAEYVTASTALSILVGGFLLSYFFMTSNRLLRTMGKTKLLLVPSFAGASLNVVLNILLIPPYGIEGAALATATSMAFGGILVGFLATRTVSFSLFQPNLLKTWLTALGCAPLLLLSMISNFPLGAFSKKIFVFVLFLLVYFSGLVLLGVFDDKDLIVVKAIERRIGISLKPIRNLISRFSKH